MKRRKRKKILVQRPIQHAVARRALAYWLYCWLGVFLFSGIWIAITQQPASSAELVSMVYSQLGVAVIATIVLLPVVYVDCIRHSHRFVGPIMRLRQQMDLAAMGEPIEPIDFRKSDYWNELAESFNSMIARIGASNSTTNSLDSPTNDGNLIGQDECDEQPEMRHRNAS